MKVGDGAVCLRTEGSHRHSKEENLEKIKDLRCKTTLEGVAKRQQKLVSRVIIEIYRYQLWNGV